MSVNNLIEELEEKISKEREHAEINKEAMFHNNRMSNFIDILSIIIVSSCIVAYYLFEVETITCLLFLVIWLIINPKDAIREKVTERYIDSENNLTRANIYHTMKNIIENYTPTKYFD